MTDDKQRKSSVSQSESYESLGDYWDTHSLAERWDETYPVSFDVQAERRRRVVIAPELYERIAAEAQRQGISAETLINLWLSERAATMGD